MKNIVLIGLPGCGKSTIGHAIAKSLSLAFIDIDNLIAQCAGISIPQIFEKYGEQGFRKLETKAVKIAAQSNGAVISTGGGIVTVPQNMQVLMQNGIVIFLDRKAQQIANDVNVDTRPMMKNNPQKIFELEQQRLPLYQTYAHYILASENSFNQTVGKAVQLCKTILAKQQYYVIGQPVLHSLSPAIHMPVLKRYLNAPFYDIQQVSPDGLPQFIQQVRNEGVNGFNVTMPHKAAIIPFLDEIDQNARLLNSVNTVVNTNGVLKGYSTDGEGFFTALNQNGLDVKDKNVLIIGAGGAASALCIKAAMLKAATITVLARRIETAQAMADNIKNSFANTKAFAGELTLQQICKCCLNADLLINATPMGMQGVDAQFESLDFLNSLNVNAMVCDLIYKPEKTLLLQTAQNKGLKTMGGLDMLIYQALVADSYYLKTKIPLQQMYLQVKKALADVL